MGGQEGGGVGGGQLEVGYTFHKDTDSNARAEFSLSDRNEYNSQHRPRRLLAVASLAPHMPLFMPPIGSRVPV